MRNIVFKLYLLFLFLDHTVSSGLQVRKYVHDHVTYRTTSPVLYQLYNVTVTYCAVRCSSYLYPCYCYIYIKQTQQCNLASWPVPSPTLLPSAQVLYSTGTFCNTTANFTIMNNGYVTSCLWMSSNNVTYSQAQADCKAKGAHLYTVKTIEKFNILITAVNNSADWYWLGLNDLVQEGVFVWEDDGSVLTADWMKVIFHPGQPNGGTNQNCVRYDYIWFPLSDFICSYQYKYICEMNPLPLQ